MIYNTLSGTKEKLVPVQEGKIGIYCCGPTTYNFIHVGNGRPLVVFDTIRRFLSYQGFDITFVSNFTDVDDKIISRAAHEGKEARELSGYYIEEYFKDADALNILRADEYPKVSEHMPEIIAFVEDLIQKGMAYPIEGDVYYAIGRFPDYGKLSKRSREDLLDGARVDVDPRKENPGDFALWKTAKPGEPFWESPWGPGRPGWHIECSAMSHKYLGESFDIHGGGADLIFPHHENEIAQSEGRFGRPMATYWVHNGFITINHEKMSKSLGNFFLLREVLELFPGQVIRFFLLSVHYRSPLDFDDEQLTVAQRGLERLKNAARNAAAFIEESKRANGGDAGFDTPDDREAPDEQAAAFLKEVAERKKQFEGAMNDDFNTALAIAALFDLARAMNAFAADSQ
ncbi:MAG: cysteine--tRNA ligase, partial [Peptococcaceae bacterium]|nr:cysteine--tRNA ligase [Peptococcaceae bacterium]